MWCLSRVSREQCECLMALFISQCLMLSSIFTHFKEKRWNFLKMEANERDEAFSHNAFHCQIQAPTPCGHQEQRPPMHWPVPKSMEVALCRATVPTFPTFPTVPTVPSLATLRDKQKLRSSEPRNRGTEHWDLLFTVHSIRILQWFAICSIGFK